MSFQQRRYIVGGVAVAVLLLGSWFWHSSTQSTLEDDQWSAYWRSVIVSVPPAEAYQSFIDTYRSTAVESQHLKAHQFGALLYDEIGVDAVTICDTSFS